MREEGFVVELVVARCAGLDVAKYEVVACVRVPGSTGGRRQEVRTYPTFTSGLEALADWLAAEGVTQVVMEADRGPADHVERVVRAQVHPGESASGRQPKCDFL